MEIIILLIALLLASGLASLFEVVILTEKRSGRFKTISLLNEEPSLFLLLFPLIITVANVLIGVLGEKIEIFPNFLKFIYLLTLSVSVVIFAEIIPKQLGFFYSSWFLENFDKPLAKLYILMRPILVVLNFLLERFFKLLNIKLETETIPARFSLFEADLLRLIKTKEYETADEILKLVKRLTTQTVSEVIIPRFELEHLKFETKETLTSFLQNPDLSTQGEYFLFEVNNNYFVMSKEELALNVISDATFLPVEPTTAYSYQSVIEVFLSLQKELKRYALVFDEFGSIDGIIDAKNIIQRSLTDPQLIKISDNKILVSASAKLGVIFSFFDIFITENLSQRSVLSVFLEKFGLPACPNQKFKVGTLEFKILTIRKKMPDFLEVVSLS